MVQGKHLSGRSDSSKIQTIEADAFGAASPTSALEAYSIAARSISCPGLIKAIAQYDPRRT